jgi:hypothetical protein
MRYAALLGFSTTKPYPGMGADIAWNRYTQNPGFGQLNWRTQTCTNASVCNWDLFHSGSIAPLSYLRQLGTHVIVCCASVSWGKAHRWDCPGSNFGHDFGDKLGRMFAVLLGRFQMNVSHKRIGLANTYGGGIMMTTLILLFGYSTPRLLRWIGKRLAYIAG